MIFKVTQIVLLLIAIGVIGLALLSYPLIGAAVVAAALLVLASALKSGVWP